MTDKDLIKALECCNKDDCDNCPYKRNCKNVMCDVLDLINRQQAEIEKLKKELQITRDAYIMLQTKNEIAKSEAVKEFAERLHDRIVNFPSVYPIENATLAFLNGSAHRQLEILEIIDNLVKEMVGEGNA